MMYDGGIYADGTPEEVLTAENILHVYGVHSEIVTYEGRPHMLASDQDIDPLAGNDYDVSEEELESSE